MIMKIMMIITIVIMVMMMVMKMKIFQPISKKKTPLFHKHVEGGVRVRGRGGGGRS